MKDSDCFFISLKAFSTSISEITAKDPLPEGLQRRPSRGGSFPKNKIKKKIHCQNLSK
jgi:hypothetical protein